MPEAYADLLELANCSSRKNATANRLFTEQIRADPVQVSSGYSESARSYFKNSHEDQAIIEQIDVKGMEAYSTRTMMLPLNHTAPEGISA